MITNILNDPIIRNFVRKYAQGGGVRGYLPKNLTQEIEDIAGQTEIQGYSGPARYQEITPPAISSKNSAIAENNIPNKISYLKKYLDKSPYPPQFINDLDYYRHNGSSILNRALRDPANPEIGMLTTEKNNVYDGKPRTLSTVYNNLISMMNPIDDDMTLYRGISHDPGELNIGDQIQGTGLISTTTDPNQAKRFTPNQGTSKNLFQIQVPKNTPAINLNKAMPGIYENSSFPENEYILPKDSIFNVIDKTPDYTVLRLSGIDQRQNVGKYISGMVPLSIVSDYIKRYINSDPGQNRDNINEGLEGPNP